MTDRSYVTRFSKMGFGLFVHFGLYSILDEGEWTLRFNRVPQDKYDNLLNEFKVKEDFAKEIVSYAKKAGCKYITITTRHHDGFSLYDTKGLSDYDVMHTPTHRDLIKELCDECRKNDILPMFYHTMLDWKEKSYTENFSEYLKYLRKSIELLCTNYGKIGGFWFDGMWDKKDDVWEEDELYINTIRKYQPEAMIINNTGLSFQGKVGHPEIDSVTFERGKPQYVDNSDRIRAGEMCQIMNNNWGTSKTDIFYHSMTEFITDLTDCRKYNCNYLLNVGPKADGSLGNMEKGILEMIGKWVDVYGESIYDVKPTDIDAGEDFVLRGKDCDYLYVHNLEMIADDNLNIVARSYKELNVKFDKKIDRIEWIDDGQKLEFSEDTDGCHVKATNYPYGTNYCVRVARVFYK